MQMQEPTSQYMMGLSQVGFHKLHYVEWSKPNDDTAVICLHGLARNCRDFDILAQALSPQHGVYAIDMAGRGLSDRLPAAPMYNFAQYMADCNAFIARLNVKHVDWIGTSMGGLVGMMLAAQKNSPIRRLVLNDVSIVIKSETIRRIREYISINPTFRDLAQAEKYYRQILATFGHLTDEQWQHVTKHSVKKMDDGKYELHYDPLLAQIRDTDMVDTNLSKVWEMVKCPVLLIHGLDSDLLTNEYVEKMRAIRDFDYVAFSDVGHAPMLMADDQISAVQDWLNKSPY